MIRGLDEIDTAGALAPGSGKPLTQLNQHQRHVRHRQLARRRNRIKGLPPLKVLEDGRLYAFDTPVLPPYSEAATKADIMAGQILGNSWNSPLIAFSRAGIGAAISIHAARRGIIQLGRHFFGTVRLRDIGPSFDRDELARYIGDSWAALAEVRKEISKLGLLMNEAGIHINVDSRPWWVSGSYEFKNFDPHIHFSLSALNSVEMTEKDIKNQFAGEFTYTYLKRVDSEKARFNGHRYSRAGAMDYNDVGNWPDEALAAFFDRPAKMNFYQAFGELGKFRASLPDAIHRDIKLVWNQLGDVRPLVNDDNDDPDECGTAPAFHMSATVPSKCDADTGNTIETTKESHMSDGDNNGSIRTEGPSYRTSQDQPASTDCMAAKPSDATFETVPATETNLSSESVSDSSVISVQAPAPATIADMMIVLRVIEQRQHSGSDIPLSTLAFKLGYRDDQVKEAVERVNAYFNGYAVIEQECSVVSPWGAGVRFRIKDGFDRLRELQLLSHAMARACPAYDAALTKRAGAA